MIEKCFNEIEFPQAKQNQNNRFILDYFVPGLSDQIKRVGKNIIYKQYFSKKKSTQNLVYKSPCDWNKSYIRKIWRPLNRRMEKTEHK